MAEFIVKKSIKFKILGIILLCLFLITAALGYFSFQFSKARIVMMLGDSIKGISNTVASFTPYQIVSIIIDNSEKIKNSALAYDDSVEPSSLLLQNLDQKTASPQSLFANPRLVYEKYSALLRTVKARSDIDSSINVYVASGNHLLAAASSEPVFFAGTVYAMRPEAKEAIRSNVVQATDIYKDKDGTWISAYAPGEYFASKDKRVVVEMNYKIDSYIRILNTELAIIIVICVVGFLIVAFISYYLVTALVAAMKKLNEAINDLEKGHYDKVIDIRTNDEIGHLARAFELLRLSIKTKIDELRMSLTRERKAHLESVVALTNAIEERDPYTKQHVSRVQEYALLIGKAMRLPHDDLVQLRYSCFLHDIGKIYIEGALLSKGKLTYEDFEEIKKHSERGAKIIEGIEFLTDVKEAVLYHQEHYDGTGYPKGLKGKDIPILARIVAVADAFDAMTTDRPYRMKMSFKKAIEEIEKNSGTQFDPEVCAAFLKYKDTVEQMVQKRFTDNA